MKKYNLTILKVNVDEIKEIINLQSANNNILLSESSIILDLKSNNSIYYIAKENNISVGYIAANLLYDHIDILGILVDKNYVRNGIASRLLETLLNDAKNLNIPDILLEVRASNISAQKLYEKYNFKKIDIRKNYYSDNLEDALVYKLAI